MGSISLENSTQRSHCTPRVCLVFKGENVSIWLIFIFGQQSELVEPRQCMGWEEHI